MLVHAAVFGIALVVALTSRALRAIPTTASFASTADTVTSDTVTSDSTTPDTTAAE